MIRVLIAEDEPLARQRLRDLLDAIPWATCAGEVSDGAAAVRAIDALVPDLVLLDIRMPGPSGIEVLEEVETEPAVIFTTAFDEYAVAAFELGAVDYLLKPFGAERFQAAMKRARRTLRDHGAGSPGDDAAASGGDSGAISAGDDGAASAGDPEAPWAGETGTASASETDTPSPSDPGTASASEARAASAGERAREMLAAPTPLSRIFVRHRGKIVPVPTAAIHRLEAQGDYVALHLDGSHHLAYLPLAEFERRLDPQTFLRIHRSHIVNLDHVASFSWYDGSRLQVEMKDGTRLLASRTRSRELRRLVL